MNVENWHKGTLSVEDAGAEAREMDDWTLERVASGAEALMSTQWELLTNDQRQARRARNEQARRQGIAERQAAQDAKAQQRQAARDAETEAYKAQVRQRAAAVFRGTTAEFERAWPGIWEAHQREQTLAALSDDLITRKRRQLGGSL